jgi:hypothetical protein
MNRYTFNISLDCNVQVVASNADAARADLLAALTDAFLCAYVTEGDENGTGSVQIIDAGTIEGEEPTLVSTETL